MINDITVNDHPSTLGSSQSSLAPDRRNPLDLRVNGLTRLRLCPFTDDEWDNLPHVTMTHNDTPWSTRRYNSIYYMDDIAVPELRGLDDYPIAATRALYGSRISGSR